MIKPNTRTTTKVNAAMCSWIIPFLIGIFVGQEIKEIPRVRPYVEAGAQKIFAVGKEISNDAQKRDETLKQNDSPVNESKRWKYF